MNKYMDTMATLALKNNSSHSLGGIYMNMMRHLSDATKLEIIQLLSASLLHKYEDTKNASEDKSVNLYSCFKGDWGKGKDSITYCEELRRDLLPAKEVDL